MKTSKKTAKSASAERFNPYQYITDLIIERLEKGDIPWIQRYTPAERKAMGPARNGKTGRPYNGINKLLLPLQGRYFTFNNVEEMGGHIKAGSKSFTAVFFKLIEKRFVKEVTDEDTGETIVNEGKQYIPVPRVYNLFHESQIEFKDEGPELPVEQTKYSGNPVDDAEDIIMAYHFREGVNIVDGADDPSYEVSTDTIRIPLRSRYTSAEGYYNDLFHELVHSTGHPSRLNRSMPAVAASHSRTYNREELTSTIGAAFLMGEAEMTSLDVIESAAGEAKHWIDALREDNHMIVWAASRASKAVNYILTGKTSDNEN